MRSGLDIDYAQLVKLYDSAPESAKGHYSPGECIGARKERIEGNPDPAHVSTSYAERQNLTMRMQMRRFTRLTNAFSKKFENHMHMVALYTVWYNFVKLHKAHRMTPAMAAGVSDRLWSMEDIAALVEAAVPKPGSRGSYKKRYREKFKLRHYPPSGRLAARAGLCDCWLLLLAKFPPSFRGPAGAAVSFLGSGGRNRALRGHSADKRNEPSTPDD